MDAPVAAKGSTLRLPPDVIGEIVSFFSDDRSTLLKCALVSQDWLFQSRPFLFRNIDLQVFEKLGLANHFISKVLHSERLRPWLTSIHHLAFMNGQDFIIDISKRLLNLRSMAWGCVTYRDALRPEVFAAFAKFTRLRHLKLDYCTFASFGDLKKVIVAFPALSSLTLSGVTWLNSANPDESPSASTPAPIQPTLSKLSVSTHSYGSREPEEQVLLWLSTTATRRTLEELSFGLRNIGAASRLMADTSLSTLDVQMDYDSDLSGDSAQFPQIRRLFSQVRHIGLLRLHFTGSWDSAACVLPLFGSVPSLHRLCFCSFWRRFYLPRDSNYPGFDVSAKQLDLILASSENMNNMFSTLRTVEFAWYFPDSEEVLREQYTGFSVWVHRMLPQLHKRCAVEVYTYSNKFVFGPTGFSEHAGGADFWSPFAKT